MSSRGSGSSRRGRGKGRGRSRGNASQSSNSQTADAPKTTTLRDDLLAAMARIEQLEHQLAGRDSPAPVPANPNSDKLATVLEAFSERLERVETRESTPASGSGARKSTKLLDPPILTDGKEPAFGRWRIQMQDKLKVNSDHFESMEAKMAYVFNRTSDKA
jgi:hypothetical protein